MGKDEDFIAFYKTKKKILEVASDFYEDVISEERKPKSFHLKHKTMSFKKEIRCLLVTKREKDTA